MTRATEDKFLLYLTVKCILMSIFSDELYHHITQKARLIKQKYYLHMNPIYNANNLNVIFVVNNIFELSIILSGK